MELNKIAAAILLAGLIGMISGKVSQMLYFGPDTHHEEGHEAKRGYSIDVPEVAADGAAPVEKKLTSLIPLLATADVAAGEAFAKKKCATCHSFDKGGKNKTGPALWGVVGREKGGVSGFNYSSAMAEKGGKWDYDTLNGFMHKPKKWLPGTIMAYVGIKKDNQRADLVAYLRSLSDSPMALPTQAQIDAVLAADVPDAAEAVDAVKDAASDAAAKGVDDVKEMGTKAADDAKAKVDAAVDAVTDKAADAATGAEDAAKTLKDMAH